MQNILNNVKSSGLKVAEYFTPVLKESKFQETGVLTPEEFVAAGDHLVHHCPTWQWASGDDSYVKDYLPKDKQFLITRNVPCYKRCYQMEYTPDLEKVLDEEEGGWVDTHHYTDDKDELNTRVSEMNLDDDGKSATASAVVGSCDADDDNQEAVDMEDFIESGMIDSESPLTEARKSLPASCAGGGEIENVRTYDLNITYDKYYQTPRLWLFGYNESKQALSVEEMYEDFSADHANKTITMETHPHLPGPPQASVHPCRHAQVMKKLIDQITEGGGELGVHMYLIVFLKFVQAIIPTVEYDFTQNIAL